MSVIDPRCVVVGAKNEADAKAAAVKEVTKKVAETKEDATK